MRIFITAWLVLFSFGSNAGDLPVDTLGKVLTLPQPYPKNWIWVQDIAFDHMSEGRMYLMDPAGEVLSRQMKGMVNGSNVFAFAQSSTRPEFYIAEHFYERLNRGKRTDVVTIYDKKTLAPVAEVELGPKRANVMPGRFALRLTRDETFLLVYFFTPATSIGVIDVAKRKLVGEVSLPSCALAFPTGVRGFSSLCGNGSLVSFQLDAAGKVASSRVIEPFFNVDADALMEKPVIIDGIGYFPTFLGNVQEINFTGEHAALGQKWDLVPEADRAQHWRPGGALVSADDSAGRMYVLMHADGKEGTHKDGGAEVWVYDVKKRARVQRITLKNWGVSIEVTRGTSPMLIVTNAEMGLDVYDAKGGAHVRTIAHFGQETPVLLHAVR